MSGNIPFEIQVEIIKWLPVKSLLQFRSVSKAWKSLIDCSDFIVHYRGQPTQLQDILVSYVDPVDSERKYVSVADDHTFPRKKVSLTIPLLLRNSMVVGCSHGLLCVSGCHPDDGRELVLLWNPCIRKAVVVFMPRDAHFADYDVMVIGFGVCRETTDPKIVRITETRRRSRTLSLKVEVFTLSTGAWRSIRNSLPRKSISFDCSHYDRIVIDGCLYWFATDEITANGGRKSCFLIMSFDMTSEEFREINLPGSLAHRSWLFMYKLRESLVVTERDEDEMGFVVWMMEDASKLFTKLFTISYNTPDAFSFIRGFRKTGEAIIEDHQEQLGVYDPYSKHINSLGISGKWFFVRSYVETLLLHDQPYIKACEAIMEDHHGQLVVYNPYSKHINNLGITGKWFYVHSYIETLLLHDQPNLKVYDVPQVSMI